MAPGTSSLSAGTAANAAAAGVGVGTHQPTASLRPGPRAWEALPAIAYGFVTYPLTPSKPLRRQSRLSPSTNGASRLGPNGLHTLREEPETEQAYDDALQYSEQATLEIGDEVYAFEQLVPDTRNSPVWYRGYVVSSSHTPKVSFQNAESSFSLASPPSTSGAADEPDVSMGIFPASHVYIRDHLADAEGRLAEVYNRMIHGQSEAMLRTVNGHAAMETLREENEDIGSDRTSSTRPRSPRGPRPARSPQPLSVPTAGEPSTPSPITPLTPNRDQFPPPSGERVKPPPPRPSVKSSDETTSGALQPLVDEIASALREWHPLMFKHLQRRDYRLFELVKGHIEALHLGRRQLLTQALSAEEMSNLRRDCVVRLVQGNVAQGLDIIVRHPTWGALVTVDSDHAHEVDPRSWMSAPRMYAMQASLAYVNQDTTAATTIAKASALSPLTTKNDRFSLLPSAPGYPSGTPSTKGATASNTTNSNTTSSVTPSASFFHLYLELRAFVASPCLPGETAELYFSLYNKSSNQFVSEDFLAVLNHNGVSARDPEGRFGPVRTFFTDLGERDVQDEIYLVCRVVRNGAMKMGGMASTNGATPNGNANGHGHGSLGRRGSEPLYRVTENGDTSVGDISMSSIATASAPVSSSKTGTGTDVAPATFRRPFGAAVVSLGVLKKFVDGSPSTDLTEYSLPIFVPTNEATYSTLHQYLIGSNTKEFEQSPRAQRIAVVVKAFHGEAETIVKENPSLLQDVPITSRLGFPDVVFPGDTRNELYIKLWSGEFFHAPGGGSRILSRASFSGSPAGLNNVQVSLEVRTRAGAVVENAVSPGSGEPPVTRYHSMVFYRNNSPTYGELVKFIIPVDLMQQCHLFFSFRHRSAKEKGEVLSSTSEKPFAFAYLPLFPDGKAFHSDGSHTLVLYRADRSPWSSAEDYYNAPPTVPEGTKVESLTIPSNLTRTAVPMRDSLTIRSLLCSTRFTQNPVLLSLLSWESLPDKRAELETVLTQFKQVAEVEIVKFLRDIFDSLFAILVSSVNDSGALDDLVFNALVTVLGIVSDRRFKNFQPVLEVYIEKHFACASAASHMIRSKIHLHQNMNDPATAIALRNSMKVGHYVMRFIVRSRELQKAKEVGMGLTSEHLDAAFKKDVSLHLNEVNKMMMMTSPASIIGTQTIALQQFPTTFPDLGHVFTPLELVDVVTKFSNSLSGAKGKMVMWKLIMYLQIVRGFLFEDAEARALLVESMVSWIKPYLGRYDEFRHTQLDDSESAKDNARIGWLETLRLSITILAVMLERLQGVLIDPATLADRKAHRLEEANVEFLLSLLPRVLESYAEFQMPANLKAIERTRSPATIPSPFPISFPSTYPFTLVASGTTTSKTVVNGVVHEIPDLFNCGLGETAVVLLVMVLASTPKDLNNFFDLTLDIEGPANLTRLLASMLTVATSILSNDAFPSKWLNVNVLAHVVLLKLAEPIGAIMIRNYIPQADSREEFDANLWFDYLHMLLKLLSSDQLVIEEFTPQKRRAVWRLAGDVRGAGADLLLRCWDALGWDESLDSDGNLLARYGSFQTGLVPLVDQVLTLCLSHHYQLRTNAVQIIYSMILSEYQQTGAFAKIKTEVINKLDELFVSENKADDVSRAFFINQLRQMFELSTVDEELRNRMLEFLASVDMFLELLISVRELPDGDEFLDDKVIATLRLMNFTREIGRDEMYIKYVHQLANVHIRSNHFVEAALTLKLHADLHEWNLMTFVDPLPDLDLPRQSSFVRKETLSLLILDYLGKGGAWENAVEICQDLAAQHMETTFNYQRLAEILKHQAALLQRIASDQRFYPGYFRVSFYGDFPAALKKQPFIYRGYDWEKYDDFCQRMLQKHPAAELLQSPEEPNDTIKYGTQPYVHCLPVTPEPDKSSPIFTNLNVPPQIRAYYEHNDVNTFSFSRSVLRGYSSGAQEVWTEKTYYTTEQLFPTVLRRSEVIDMVTVELSPVDSALQQVEEQIKELSQMHVKFDILSKIDAVTSTNALSMALNEIVDTPADSGLSLYRQTFLTGDYVRQHPAQEQAVLNLREAINKLTILVDQCLRIHGALCPEEMLPFHTTLEGFFRRNFHEEIARLSLDTSPMRRSIRHSHSRDLPPSGASTSSVGAGVGPGGERLSRAMTLGRGGPSLYAPGHLSQMYNGAGAGMNGTPGSPHALHFDSQGALVPGLNGLGAGGSGSGAGRPDQPTPLQRNLAQLARHGIPGMSTALLSGGGGAGGVNGGGSPFEHTPSKSALGSDPVLVGKPSMSSFVTGSPGAAYQQSMISRNASVANTISGRLSRFGSMLGRKDR